MMSVLNTLGSGGLVTVFLFTGLALGFAWALDLPQRARVWIIGIAVASLPLSQFLPAGNPFREQIAQSLGALLVGAVFISPILVYAVVIRKLRRRAEPPPPPPRQGLGLIEEDAALNADMHAKLVAMNLELGPYEKVVFSLVHRDSRGEIEGALRVIIVLGRAEFTTFWVEPEARGKGIGGILIRAAENEARMRGATVAVLDTFSWQNAMPFYEKAGFRRAYTRAFPAGPEQYFYEKEL
ncbi:GNAT superfamily N-acetyltransferase [Rubricella aquisinus]|uniref:GNAT superfamily N-acetyltransferase n=1 Tax=Rubricella aquisinus TaxID=2028108 RepID=A0A840X2B5_9RHOB|nr:GNAT family N-acetyltransferase [Rubricella aquisinus]MBB5516954.1 GNAT superfamily N-acetyltransferase [Rubricella aquisinus]